MPENPYKASHQPIQPLKVRSRFMFLTDLAAIFCAAVPLFAWLGLNVVTFLYSFDDVIDPFFEANLAAVGYCAILILVLFVASAIYNFIGTLNGRRTAFVGVLTNLASVALWVISIVLA
jgi:hypothetical protein